MPYTICGGISVLAGWVMLVGLLLNSGCQTVNPTTTEAVASAGAGGITPQELHKTVLPTYVIEPPDVLTIEALRVVPHSPYHLRNLDLLAVQVQGTFPDVPINGIYVVEPPGFVKLGPRYGAVQVSGMTLEEAEAAIQKQLLTVLLR